VTVINLDILIKELQILLKKYKVEIIDFLNFKYSPNKVKDIESITGDFSIKRSMFKIGNIIVKNPVVSAPLAGISDNTYRIFARAFGSALNYTEMISSYGIYYKHKKSFSLADVSRFERPCGLQIFGSEPEIMLEAAFMVEKLADFIDINMGCPVPKVLKNKSGGYLLRDEKRISDIISIITSKIKKPVTVKLRIGWDRSNINVLKIAKIAEFNGASAVAVHGRTVRQGFSGGVDYEVIKEVKEGIDIPVIVSGDINSFTKASNILDYSGCDAVMIGRASKGNPWIFFNIIAGLISLEYKGEPAKIDEVSGLFDGFTPSIEFKKDLAKLYLKFMIHFKGEEKAVREFRKCISWIFKGIKGISRMRENFVSMKNIDDVFGQIDNI